MLDELRQAALEAGFKRVAADYWLDRCTEWHEFLTDAVKRATERAARKAEEAKNGNTTKTN